MTKQEEMALRELAAKPHYLPQVAAALGPLSLWSKDGIEAEIRRAVEAERNFIATKWENLYGYDKQGVAEFIRKRANTQGETT